MLGFVHSATCLRAANFGIPHDHLTPEMTHLECGRIIPAVSTTTGIIVGFLLNEMIKYKMGVTDANNLHEYQINLASPAISRNYLMPAKFRELNYDLKHDFNFLAPKNPKETENGTMNSQGYYNAWHKYEFDGMATTQELYDFVLDEFG